MLEWSEVHTKNGKTIKVVAIILACGLLDIVLHIVTSSYSTMPKNPNLSLVAGTLGTEITASLWALFAFSGVALCIGTSRMRYPEKV
jgi:hypothetical protein